MAKPKRSSKTEHLGLYMNGLKVGLLERGKGGELSFRYGESWLERPNSMAISRMFPLQEKKFIGQPVRDYFDNLLPDDRRVRERVAARAQAGGSQAFDILAAVGRDCVGALQFYPESEGPGPVKTIRGRVISNSEIAELLKNLRINPLGIRRENDFRISLAGAQSKTALLRNDGEWLIPEGATPTTHILKPAIGKVPDGPDLSLSVENEWLCLKLLAAYGIKSASTEIAEFDGIKALVVERFDRSWSGKKLYRLPQEDFCQAMGFGPNQKYEADGGPGIGEALALLNESDHRDLDRQRFMKAQILFWMMAAIDGHAKNFSLLIRPGGFAMTPLYDVLSAEPHIDKSTLPSQRIKLAMSVGKGRYKVNEIFPRHWIQMASECKFDGIENLLHQMAEATPKAIEEVASQLPRGFPSKVSEPIFQSLLKRSKILTT